MPRRAAPTRVVITGMGWVTPLGADVYSVWTKLLAGVSAVGPLTRFAGSTFATNFAAEVRGFELDQFLADHAPHAAAHLQTRFALAAAAQAWKQAGLGDVSRTGLRNAGFPGLNPRRVGLYMGAGEGIIDLPSFAGTNLESWDAAGGKVDDARWAGAAYRRMAAEREIEQEPNAALSHLAEAFGCRGPAFNCMTACAASTQSIGEAYELIRRGDADVMLAGGAHSMIHPLGMTGFVRLTAMSRRTDSPQTAARPFDATRDGFVMGEGAGVLVLEDLGHALARGARPLAEVVGFGSSADAYRITDIQPEGAGAQAAIEAALRQAGIDPREPDARGRPPVQYISAHGTGTKENDSIETRAVKAVFGPLAPKIPFSSVKSMFGHLIQAAGAVELMTCVLAIETGFVPPTINLQTPDPQCDLDHVPNRARDLREAGGVDVAISNSFGFGGQNDTIAVRRWRGGA
ncbi:MAG: beta-ketoacyl-[acyl-carrier-protein] synthase family protein [Phycisphaerales bacterium]|nr:beta-ketoacyl-[acyl-carrier-protein] synthase family protein [Phycisphaerales bacterium]